MLLARIDDLNRCYGHMIDDGEFEYWPGLFIEEGLYKITTRWNHERNMPAGLMLCDSRAMMEDRISALRTANIYEPQSYRHLIDPPLLIEVPNGVISVQTSFVVFRTMQSEAPEIFNTGKYLDKLVEVDGALKFKERIVVCDSERIDTMIVIPL
ncbi:MAG: aromatic-ring-hydroxylating dioxygenase subunit beta [Rhodospirillaceae bacterium]|nr:aromatic-ring-hydroxylating dioxygenase subunit beta [Rhodospirillaceae bacterium]MBT5456744.1 aromatic-ring-hydroxylating dioxygenase subunit beta [Rhodospirillaceae bacterium]